MLNGLDLFSGIGGIGIAISPWVRTVAYCEKDRYAQGVLLSRMLSGDIDRAPIWDDITSLRGSMLPSIDIIFGGFPCQDISVAGRGVGLEGKRSGLFYEVARLVEEISPRFVFLENVPAIRTRGGETVVKTLASIGYDCRWTTLSAASVGACHIRERWFLLAHSNSELIRIKQGRVWRSSRQRTAITGDDGEKGGSPDSNGARRERKGQTQSEERRGYSESTGGIKSPVGYGKWISEPTVCGGINGLPNRVDRVKCLGNSVVPLQAREAFKKLCGVQK